MTTIDRQIYTIYLDESQPAALVAGLKADDPETDYRVVENAKGWFVAIFEDGEQAYSL